MIFTPRFYQPDNTFLPIAFLPSHVTVYSEPAIRFFTRHSSTDRYCWERVL